MEKTLTKAPSFRWVMLLLNILAYGQFFLTVQVPTAFGSYIIADLGIPAAQAALFGTIILGVFALTGSVGAQVTDKLGLKKSVCVAILVNVLGGLLILVLGKSFIGYAVCCAVEGLSGGLICGAMTSSTAFWFPVRQRGLASGILLGILGVGFSIATFFAPRLMGSGMSWQMGACLLTVVPGVVITVLYFLFAKEVSDVYPGHLAIAELLPPEASDAPKYNVDSLPKSMPELKRQSYFWWAAVCGFITGANVYGFPAFVNGLLVEKGLDVMLANAITSITFFTSIFGSPLGGLISDKVFKGSRWQIVCLGNLVIVASLLVVAFTNGMPLTIAMIVAYTAVSTVMGPFWTIPAELGHPSIATQAAGFLLIFGNLGGCIIGFILTALASAFGSYYICMYVCLGMAAVSALGVSRIRR